MVKWSVISSQLFVSKTLFHGMGIISLSTPSSDATSADIGPMIPLKRLPKVTNDKLLNEQWACYTQCNAYQIDVKIAEFQQFFLRGDWTFVEYSKKLAYGMMSGSVASNLVDLWWQESKNFLYVPSADQINVKIVEFQQFFLRGGLDFSGIFRQTPLGNDVRKLDTKFGWPTMTRK